MRLSRSIGHIALLSLTCAAAGCAIPERPVAVSPAAATRFHDAVDWQKAGDETVELLRGYLRVDTINPPGNETRGARYMADVLEREKIPYVIVESAPGRGNLIARIDPPPGTATEAPLCLFSHIDVVTAETEKWPADKGPLSGAIAPEASGPSAGEPYIWGRGALDMKGLGALELETMVLLQRLHVPLKRSVILLAVAGEETDSSGAQYVVDKHWDKLQCSHSVNEGGIGIKDLLVPDQTVYTISVAEKGTLWLRMTAHGEAGHGSTPAPGRAPDRLITAMRRLKAREDEPTIHPSLYELAARVGHETGGLAGFVLTRPFLVDRLVLEKLMENPAARATLFNTVNITGFSGMKEPNVIPSEVTAVIDARVLPGTPPEKWLEEIKKTVDDPNITFDIIDARGGNESPWEDPFFAALVKHAVDGRAHVVAGPALSPGYTDSLFLRNKGVHAYGFVPFEVTKDELLYFHGKNERVSVANVKRGVRALFRAVVDVSAK